MLKSLNPTSSENPIKNPQTRPAAVLSVPQACSEEITGRYCSRGICARTEGAFPITRSSGRWPNNPQELSKDSVDRVLDVDQKDGKKAEYYKTLRSENASSLLLPLERVNPICQPCPISIVKIKQNKSFEKAENGLYKINLSKINFDSRNLKL